MEDTLYQTVMGAQFAELDPVLRRFHSARGGRGNGSFRVRRGAGWLRGLLAAIMGLPPAGEQVPAQLEVTVEGNRERWCRDFGGRRLVTMQRGWHGLLLESGGPVTFSFALQAEAGGMIFIPRQVWFLGVPLPRWARPNVEAWVKPAPPGWQVRVLVCVPLLGMLAEYEGVLTPVAEGELR